MALSEKAGLEPRSRYSCFCCAWLRARLSSANATPELFCRQTPIPGSSPLKIGRARALKEPRALVTLAASVGDRTGAELSARPSSAAICGLLGESLLELGQIGLGADQLLLQPGDARELSQRRLLVGRKHRLAAAITEQRQGGLPWLLSGCELDFVVGEAE